MELSKAKEIAAGIVAQLKPYCERLEVAGSIRRGKPEVHDIDLVVIPTGQQFYKALQQLGKVTGGPKIYKVELPVVSQGKPFCVDINIATEKTWATLLLVKTGSKEHNIMLCKLAHSKHMKLHADGSGLLRDSGEIDMFGGQIHYADNWIPCATETDIFNALGLNYKAPGERG